MPMPAAGDMPCALSPMQSNPSQYHWRNRLVLGAVGGAPAAHARHVAGSAVHLLEGEDHPYERLLGRFPGRDIGGGEHEPFVLADLQVHSAVRKLLPAGAYIRLGMGNWPEERREPLHEQRGLSPGAKQLLARGIDEAGEGEPSFIGYSA
jgi:hypothetical protein